MKLLKEKHLYSFGEFTLNVEDQSFNRNGENIPITPKMFDLLLVLVQNPQRVLRKEFFFNRSGRTVLSKKETSLLTFGSCGRR